MHDTGAMAPAGQLWSTVEDLAPLRRLPRRRPPRGARRETLAEMRRSRCRPRRLRARLRLCRTPAGCSSGHTGSMPGFQATAVRRPASADVGVVALTNATTGFSGTELALALLGEPHPGGASAPWVPGASPCRTWARELLGLWYWGNSAFEVALARRPARAARPRPAAASPSSSAVDGDRIVGVAGYHHGETLHVVRRDDGSVDHLECATFVFTRALRPPPTPVVTRADPDSADRPRSRARPVRALSVARGLRHVRHVEVGDAQGRGGGAGEVVLAPLAREARARSRRRG